MTTDQTEGRPTAARSPALSGAVLLVIVGALVTLASCSVTVWHQCEPYELRSAESVRLHSPGVAVAIPSNTLEAAGPSRAWPLCSADYDRRKVRVSARETQLSTGETDGEHVFVGVAPASDGRRYLNRARHTLARYDWVSDWASEGLGLEWYRAGAEATRLGAPERQAFWLAKEQSSLSGPARLAVTWPTSGARSTADQFQLVFMRADGSGPVTADVNISIEVSETAEWPYWLACLAGIAAVAAGIVVLKRLPRVRWEP